MKTTCTLKKFTSNEWVNILPKMFFKSVTNDLNLTELSIQSHLVALWAFTLRVLQSLLSRPLPAEHVLYVWVRRETMGMVPSGGEVQLQHCTKTCQEHSHLALTQECEGLQKHRPLETTNPPRIPTLLEALIRPLVHKLIHCGAHWIIWTTGHKAGGSPAAQRKSEHEPWAEPRVCPFIL